MLEEIFIEAPSSLQVVPDADIALTTMDARRFLRAIRPGVASIVFLDPPFNLGKTYGEARTPEALAPPEYERYLGEVLSEAVRIMAPGGSLFLYHVPFWATRFAAFLNEALTFRHWIAVDMKNGFVRGRRLYPAHYALLYYSKGEPGYFVRPRLQAKQCRHCHREIKDYGGYAGIIREKGLNLTDLWDDLSPVRHDSTKHRPGNELPLALTDRVVHISGPPGGVLVDPFVGAGTSLVSALEHGLRAIGNDRDPRAITVSKRRLRVAIREVSEGGSGTEQQGASNAIPHDPA